MRPDSSTTKDSNNDVWLLLISIALALNVLTDLMDGRRLARLEATCTSPSVSTTP